MSKIGTADALLGNKRKITCERATMASYRINLECIGYLRLHDAVYQFNGNWSGQKNKILNKEINARGGAALEFCLLVWAQSH